MQKRRRNYKIVDSRLETSIQRALSLGQELTDEQKREILEKRAQELAHPIEEDEQRTGETLRVISFHLGEESYAVPAASVTNVSKSISITPVPCVPDFVAGITNVRGHIRSVVLLARFLGVTIGEDKEEYVVVAQHRDVEVAFLVTGLDEVTDILVKDIKARPAGTASIATQYIAGLVPGGLIILDLPAIFTDERFIVNDEIA